MRSHTSTFKEKINEFGREIKGRIIYYNSYNIITENDDNILTENDLQLITEQPNYDDPIEINEEDIYSISVIKNGNLLQSLMKELDFEVKQELNIGSFINAQLGLLTGENTYEYLDYGNFIINSKEFNMDTETWSYVCYDKMLFSMIKYKGLNNVTYPITIKQYLNLLCNKIGLEFKDSNFVNYDQLIYEDIYKDRGLIIRDIFDEISKISAGNLLINGDDKLEMGYPKKTSEASLPDGYTQVDYIESSGTQYIDSGILPSENIGFEIDFTPHNDMNKTTAKTIFGSRTTWKSNGYQLTTYTEGTLNGGHFLFGTNDTASLIRHSAYMQKDVRCQISFLNGVFKSANGNETNIQGTFFNVNKNIYLFGCIERTSPFELSTTTLYKLKFYDNGNLVRNFIPCFRNSDNEVGLYDLVSNTFFTNQGTGNFTYNDEVLDTINEDYLKDVNVRMSEKIGIINSVAILDTDNDLQYIAEDTQSIKQNQMTRITITDNLIALNGETQDIADNVLNQLNGFYYYINDFTTTGVCYYDYLDIYNVDARGNNYQCLLLNNEITITQGIEEQIFTEELEKCETSANEYTTSVISNKQVQFKINQQEGKIESKVEKDGVISAINQSAEEIQINASKLSFEGATINMTADNVKIKGENLDIDSSGTITLSDNSAEAKIDGVTEKASYIVTSETTATPSGTTVNLDLSNKVLASGIDTKANISYEYEGITTTYINGITTSSFSQPRILLYIENDENNRNDLDISMNGGIIYSSTTNGSVTTPLKILPNGDITCRNVYYSGSLTPISPSKAEKKKNFEKLLNAKEILKNVDIYRYNFKDEKDGDKKSIGFVIGDNFNYSQELTTKDNNEANLYSMVSVLWQVVKEQQEEINELKEVIKNGKY